MYFFELCVFCCRDHVSVCSLSRTEPKRAPFYKQQMPLIHVDQSWKGLQIALSFVLGTPPGTSSSFLEQAQSSMDLLRIFFRQASSEDFADVVVSI